LPQFARKNNSDPDDVSSDSTNTIRSKISFIQIRLVQIDVIQAPNFHGMFMSVSSSMSKFMYINAFHVSVRVLKVHMLSYVHT
jgi:hypothetical protein